MKALWVAWFITAGVLVGAWVFLILTLVEAMGGGWRGWTGGALITLGVLVWTFTVHNLLKPTAVPDA